MEPLQACLIRFYWSATGHLQKTEDNIFNAFLYTNILILMCRTMKNMGEYVV